MELSTLGLVILLGGWVGVAEAQSETGSANKTTAPDRIVFSSFRPANWDIYYFAEPGTEPRRLTHHPNLDYDAVFSPDGRWVVFTSERRGSPGLFVLDLKEDAPQPRLLIESEAMEDQAAFSPDGKELAFMSTVSGTADIYRIPFRPGEVQTMDAAQNLTQHPSGNFRPSYSPDGAYIAFSSDRGASVIGLRQFPFSRQREGDIYVLELATGRKRQLTDTSGWDGSPIWSADGETIYYYSDGGKRLAPSRPAPTQRGGFRIWTLAADGGKEPRPISPEGIEALSPRITPGGRLAFVSRKGPGYDAEWRVISMDFDGSGLRADSPPGNDYWHPDYDETSGAMVCHGPGPVEETEILGHPWLRQGPLLPPGYPITKQIYDHEVALYATRNLFEVSPHPSRPEIALSDWQGYAEDSGQSLLLANMQGNDPQEIIGISDALSSTNRFFGIRWSKEAKRITYTLGPFFGGPKAAADVWTIRPDGSQTLNLTDNPKSNDGMADFSSDGEWLVFRSGRDGTFNLHWMRADGTGLRPLTDNRWQENHAAVSPTANRVAFVSNRDGVPYPIPNYGENDEPESAGGDEGQYDSKDEHYLTTDIYMLHLTEKGKIKKRVRITNSPGHDAHPRFSPDGKWLIFASERGGINDEEPLIQEIMFEPQMYGDLYARRLADGVTIRLTHDKWENGAPFWVGPARPERDPRTSDSGSVQ